MGTVFRAVDESLDRMVAVKFLLPELQEEPALVERFRREARATASIRHRNVIQIYSFGRHGSSDFFVAEYLPGQTADRIIESALSRGEQLPLPDVLWILDQTSAGLAAIHDAGVVHRDVKPGNLMVDTADQRVVIMDFGIGRRFGSSVDKGTLAPGGTPAYMPPEVISGVERVRDDEFVADIYALGVTAFELVTLELPFASESWVDILHKHLTEPAPAPSSVRPGLPKEVDELILRCLAKDPADRFQTARELRAALAPLLESGEDTMPPGPRRLRPSPVPPPPASRPARAQTARVVVADRSPEFRARVHECAKRTVPGAVVEAARSASDGLDLARRGRTDVLVVPLRDPDANAIEVAAMLRGDDELSDVRLIVVADRRAVAERDILTKLGAHAVVTTPVTEQDLEDALRRAVGREMPAPRTA